VDDSPPLLFAVRSALRRAWGARRFRFEPSPPPASRQLLVDVSVIIQNDAQTGIQRVVRALLGRLRAMPLDGFTVLPVFASRHHGFCRAQMTADGAIRSEGSRPMARRKVEPRTGDVFLGLDLASNILPYAEGEIASWRRKGVAINFVVYDVLPLTQPDWFVPKTVRNFSRWIGVIARQADRCICISQVVAQSLRDELRARGARRLPEISAIPLGADLAASFPDDGLPADIAQLRAWVAAHRVLLSVGTIEPRKGHRCVLEAMTHHWQAQPDSDLALLVIGKPGWNTEDLQADIRQHPEYGRRLRWLDSASDELLTEMYRSASGLVAASRGEGFGLPLLEALSHHVPVLARDLPVFREVGGDFIHYFNDDAPAALAAAIENWIKSLPGGGAVTNPVLPTWNDSALALADTLGVAAGPVGGEGQA
jgi:glycosyltransferase involved in cell wall biosynthesis